VLVEDAKATPIKTKPNPNSAVVWHYGGATTPEDQAKLGRDYYFGRTMSTVAVQDGILYAGELAGYLHCLDFKTGKPHWVYDLKSAVWGSPYLVDNKVFIGTDDGEVWVFPHGAKLVEPKKMAMHKAVQMAPVVTNGTLYILAQSHLYAIAPTK
jgi:outer membrane protein assembly factor BamB